MEVQFQRRQPELVEVASVTGELFVRDTKDRGAGYLAVGSAEAVAFVAALSAGEFDHLL